MPEESDEGGVEDEGEEEINWGEADRLELGKEWFIVCSISWACKTTLHCR